VLCGAYEPGNLGLGENGRVEEEREETGIAKLEKERRVILGLGSSDAHRSRKGANALKRASQRKRSAAPENRVGKERSSAKRRSEGRARLCGGARVGGGGGVGGGVPMLLGCELMEGATDWDGEGTLSVDGVSGIDGNGAGVASVAWGGGTCGGELFTLLIVWTVRL
jgi:hypothetical protein